jgi:hypothetical protein
MSKGARVIRQFETPGQFVTLERAVVLPSPPTIGTRLDLRAEGVEAALEVVGVTLRTESNRPGPPSVDVFLAHEPLAAAQLAREGGWRDAEQARTFSGRYARSPRISASGARPQITTATTRTPTAKPITISIQNSARRS